MGGAAHLRLPRRRHQWRVRRAEPGQRQDPVHPGAPRGDGRVHGQCPRQVHRRTGRVHCHFRPRRIAFAHGPVRRAHGPHAGAGHRRPTGTGGTGWPLSAGAGPAVDVQGRGRCIRPAGIDTGAGAPPARPCSAYSRRRTPRHCRDPAQRPAGPALPRTPQGSRYRAFRHRLQQAQGGAFRAGPATCRGCTQRWTKSGDTGRCRRTASHRTGDRGS
ncbi:hypothetical protein D3C79_583850 [compost metagenome]